MTPRQHSNDYIAQAEETLDNLATANSEDIAKNLLTLAGVRANLATARAIQELKDSLNHIAEGFNALGRR